MCVCLEYGVCIFLTGDGLSPVRNIITVTSPARLLE